MWAEPQHSHLYALLAASGGAWGCLYSWVCVAEGTVRSLSLWAEGLLVAQNWKQTDGDSRKQRGALGACRTFPGRQTDRL